MSSHEDSGQGACSEGVPAAKAAPARITSRFWAHGSLAGLRASGSEGVPAAQAASPRGMSRIWARTLQPPPVAKATAAGAPTGEASGSNAAGPGAPAMAKGAAASPPPPPAQLQTAAGRIFRRVYSITFSGGAGGGASSSSSSSSLGQHSALTRKCPTDFTRESWAMALQDAHRQAFGPGSASVPANALQKVMVFREKHADGRPHLYAVVLADRPYGFQAAQRVLQNKYGAFASWGTSHTCFWQCILYASIPSVHKAAAELDPEPWHSQGSTLREELAHVPRHAKPFDRNRVLAHLGLAPPAAPAAAASVLHKTAFADRILSEQWRTAEDVAEAAGKRKAEDPVLHDTVLQWGRQRVADFVQWVWAMEGGAPEPSVDRLARLRAVAAEQACACQGRWQPAATYLLNLQQVSSRYFRWLVCRALRLGRRKDVNLLITGVPDSGKSFLLRPLLQIFQAFEARGQRERFPLQGLPGCDVCVLQDVRYESFGLPWDDWLRWGDGETVMVNVPRTAPGAKSVQYRGTAPLFGTMACMFHYPLSEARATGRDPELENVQWRSRWRVVEFRHCIPAEQRQVDLPACGRCAAAWLAELADAGDEEDERRVQARLA